MSLRCTRGARPLSARAAVFVGKFLLRSADRNGVVGMGRGNSTHRQVRIDAQRNRSFLYKKKKKTDQIILRDVFNTFSS